MDSKNKYCIGDVVVLRSEVYKIYNSENEMSVRTSSFDGYAVFEIGNNCFHYVKSIGYESDFIFYFAKIEEIKLDSNSDKNEYKCYNSISNSCQWAYEKDIVCNTCFKDLSDAMLNGSVSMYIDNKDKDMSKEESVTLEKITTKDSRKVLFEDNSCILEKRNNRYYFSLYNEETGEFIREISIYVKENGKVSIAQYA